MVRYLLTAAMVLAASVAQAQCPRCGQFHPPYDRPVANAFRGGLVFASEALDEVNATRAQKGLRPFLRDDLLTQGAMACAQARAASLTAGHTSNDFGYLPQGAHADSAGCAAWEPSWGWGSCCTYDNYRYAGAAWVMGSDGRRYMHIFCRR